ncbi:MULTISPECIES: hypothetical protein [unclassified Cellulophaga]|uniref:hypothetical protein n=1 Tax=unclassified Cellulophaga TaxID=2634405 RepID=UPI000C2C774A|nr:MULTISPECIES: hypothetical protein [unclassified Cellulophaga]MDO6491667.1 heavy-metal-associated domain-containing protein [Cellulophaga sp. 2_MG-2023]MDO6493544.1 heavy-metal-associated domain-containing protein [Cellulophaga sp. 3_MG-2023]PKB44471.1 hypothetical protein AX016_2690 [Cellulophaga sp. RHA19]
MSLLSDNVIPGNHGKIFTTNAKEQAEIAKTVAAILTVEGIKDVLINADVFPAELTVHTTAIVEIEKIENAVKTTGFHAIPKGGLFQL